MDGKLKQGKFFFLKHRNPELPRINQVIANRQGADGKSSCNSHSIFLISRPLLADFSYS